MNFNWSRRFADMSPFLMVLAFFVCGDLAVLGLRQDRVIAATGRDDARIFENFTGPFASSEGSRWYEKYTDWECVIVKRKGQNKHISNYFLPVTHNLSDRDGRFFFYIRKHS